MRVSYNSYDLYTNLSYLFVKGTLFMDRDNNGMRVVGSDSDELEHEGELLESL